MPAYTKVNVLKSTTPNSGIGGKKKDIMYLFDWDDVVSSFTRNGNSCSGIPFNSGKYMIQIYGTMNTIKPTSDSSGNFDETGINQGLDFKIPCDEEIVRDLRSNWINRKSGVVIEKADGTKRLYGDPTAPLGLNFKGVDDEKENTTTMTFKSIVLGPDVATYTGTYTLSTDPLATVAPNATTVDVTNGQGNYQLSTGTVSAVSIAAITATPNPVAGGVYSLLGSGGTYPSTIATSTTIILNNGVTWTAAAGAKLTLKCYQDGPTSFKFYEINRV